MTRRILVAGMGAIAVGLAAAVLVADSDLLALQVWAGASLAWFSMTMARSVITTIGGEAAELRPVWRRRVQPAAPQRPQILRISDGQLGSAFDRARVFNARLRPRLGEVLDRANLSDVELGRAAWFNDHRIVDRTPTREELDDALTALEQRL